MPFVSVTRLHIRSARFLPWFVYHTWRSARQIRRAPGFLDGRLALGGTRSFWTVTSWLNEAAMRAYRNADAHMRAMPKLMDWCDEAAVAHWEQDAAALPGMVEAQRRMIADGRPSKVRHPSEAHATGRIPADATLRDGPRLRPFSDATTLT